MAKRAKETFITAANTVDGRPVTFFKDGVVPDQIAKALSALVYDDGAKSVPTSDGAPPEVHSCDECEFVAKSAAGLGAHARVHSDED